MLKRVDHPCLVCILLFLRDAALFFIPLTLGIPVIFAVFKSLV